MQLSTFSGMTLTEIFEIQPLQSLFIKFWYLGLTSEQLVAPEDVIFFKSIRKSLTFANCFGFQMSLRTYINFIEKVLLTLANIEPKKTFDILLGHLRNNKVVSVSFQLFGVAFLQLFGRILELMNTQTMSKLLRTVFLELTVISKTGVATLKTKGIKPIVFEQKIQHFRESMDQRIPTAVKVAEQVPLNYGQDSYLRDLNVKTLKGRLQMQRNHNIQKREGEGGHLYPIGDKMRCKDKANISCFMMSGFDIVDYSDSINQLHKKLLTKILLNK